MLKKHNSVSTVPMMNNNILIETSYSSFIIIQKYWQSSIHITYKLSYCLYCPIGILLSQTNRLLFDLGTQSIAVHSLSSKIIPIESCCLHNPEVPQRGQ